MALSKQKACVVNTFIERPEDLASDDEQDMYSLVRSCTEPARCKRLSDLAESMCRQASIPETEETEEVDRTYVAMSSVKTFDPFEDQDAAASERATHGEAAMPVQRIRVKNTFVETDDGDNEGEADVVRQQTEPIRLRHSFNFRRAASVEENETEELDDMCAFKTFDPFNETIEEEDAEEDMLDMCPCKTFDPFEQSGSYFSSTVQPAFDPKLPLGQQLQQVGLLQSLPVPVAVLAIPVSPSGSPSHFCQQASPAPVCQEAHPDATRSLPVVAEALQDLPRLLGKEGVQTVADAKESAPEALSMLYLETMASGRESVRWNVDGRKLKGKDQQILSPEFNLEFPGHGPQTFRLMIHAKMKTRHKGGQTFLKSKGVGHVCIKAKGSMPEDISKVAFKITIGQESRGPFWNQFAEQNCCELQGLDEDWDLLAALGSSKHLHVRVEVADFDSASN